MQIPSGDITNTSGYLFRVPESSITIECNADKVYNIDLFISYRLAKQAAALISFSILTLHQLSLPLSIYSNNLRIGINNSLQSLYWLNILHIVFIDNVQITDVMSVTLLEFKGRKQDNINLLTWRTATEQNNLWFELQRKAPSDY